MTLPNFVLNKLNHAIKFSYYSSINDFLETGNASQINVIYMDKIFNETSEYNDFCITKNELYNSFKKDIIILHPLPRTKELPKVFDKHPGAVYFYQAQNGLYVRASLFLSYF